MDLPYFAWSCQLESDQPCAFTATTSEPAHLTRCSHSSYLAGDISEGLISLRPPQKTLVYETGTPTLARWSSIACLCASTVTLSVPCATAMMLTFANSGPPSRQ